MDYTSGSASGQSRNDKKRQNDGVTPCPEADDWATPAEDGPPPWAEGGSLEDARPELPPPPLPVVGPPAVLGTEAEPLIPEIMTCPGCTDPNCAFCVPRCGMCMQDGCIYCKRYRDDKESMKDWGAPEPTGTWAEPATAPPPPTAAPESGGKPPAEPSAPDMRAAADLGTTATPMPTCDPGEVPSVEQIHDWLAVFATNSPAVEIRVVNPLHPEKHTGKEKYTHGVRFADLRRAAEYAYRWSGEAMGCYFTLNPLKGLEVKGKTAGDEDISRRMWLYIDCDPERGEHKKDSATDEEKDRAWGALCKVRDWLRARGWPEPIVCDSGNGWHLYYRIDLPNDDDDTLVKRVLEALDQRFSTGAVTVDPVNKNAGRITKCFGTLACKGPDTPERPHRYAQVCSVPDVLEVVPREMLESVASEPPPARLDLDAEIARKRAQHAPAEARKARDVATPGDADEGIGVSVADGLAASDPWPGFVKAIEWTYVRTFADGTSRVLRPGGSGGSSGTIGWNGQNLLYIFSSGAAPFKGNTAYSPFDAYATAFHGGDASAAAKDLYQKGYGTHFEWVWDAGDGRLIEMEHPASGGGLVWATGTGAREWVMKEFRNPLARGHQRATSKNKPDGPPRGKGHAARPSPNGTGRVSRREMAAGTSGAAAQCATSEPSVNGYAARTGQPADEPSGGHALEATGEADGAETETATETPAEPSDVGGVLETAGAFKTGAEVLADEEFLKKCARLAPLEFDRVVAVFKGKPKIGIKEFKRAVEAQRSKLKAQTRTGFASSPLEVNEADDDPHRLARVVASTMPGTLVRFRGDYWTYQGTHWQPDPEFVGEVLVSEVKAELDECNLEAIGQASGDGGPPTVIKVTRSLIADVDQALGAIVTTRRVEEPPYWLNPAPDDPDPAKVLPVRNGLLDLSGDTPILMPHTKDFFSPLCLPFRYDPDAPEPMRWNQLLKDQWADDPETIQAIHEQIGYLLLPDISLHVIFLWIGPTRSGRGTMAHVLTNMVGSRNVTTTSPAALGGPFGLQPLIGKTVALMGDARTGDTHDTAIMMDRLLRISGGDGVEINRKNKPILESVQLKVRFLILSNELPNFRDQSGAIVARYHVIRATRTIPQKDRNPNLSQEIIAEELPGILNQAIAGLYRLRARGHFLQPASAEDMIEGARILASPAKAFVEETCNLGPDFWEEKDLLFRAWCTYCEKHRHTSGNSATFGKNLMAACAGIRAGKKGPRGEQVPCYEGIQLRPDKAL